MLGQLLAAVAPWADASAEGVADARPHVELDGTRLHHAHVDSQCALCAAQHLPAGAVSAASHVGPPGHAPRVTSPSAAVVPAVDDGGVHLSRAPPIAH